MNNFNLSPRIVPLQFALVPYEKALEYLDHSQTSLSTEEALEILSARDELQNALKTTERVPVDILSQVMQLDLRLKQKAGKILKVLNLLECRESLSALPQDWWWHLDGKQVNWLIRGLTVIAWTGSLGLLANIASRFLSGGVGVIGATAVVFPSLLTLLQARSELTEAVALLNQGLLQAGEQESFPEVKYNLFKNLGWARFLQKERDIEAQQALQAAIGIASNPEVAKYLENRGSAHCLLAQVLQRQKKPSAIQQWQQCCQLGSTMNPDEDTWLHLAHKKLQEAGKSCKNP